MRTRLALLACASLVLTSGYAPAQSEARAPSAAVPNSSAVPTSSAVPNSSAAPSSTVQEAEAESGEEAARLLAKAEAAYHAIQLEACEGFARSALSLGELSQSQTALAYRLMGDSLAARGLVEPAREAYLRLLAIHPAERPNEELNPQLQAPFVEARSYWEQRGPALSVAVQASPSAAGRQVLSLSVTDPLGLARSLVLHRRELGVAPQRFALGPESRSFEVALQPSASSVEYWLSLRDERDNRLYVAGSAEQPQRLTLALPPAAPPKSDPATTSVLPAPAPSAPAPLPSDESSIWGSPWLWVGVGVVVVGSVAAATYALSDEQHDVNVGVRF